jgi:hypothetical protein
MKDCEREANLYAGMNSYSGKHGVKEIVLLEPT